MTSGVGRFKGERGLFEVGDLITPDDYVTCHSTITDYNRYRHTIGYFSNFGPALLPSHGDILLILDKRIEHSPSMWCIVYLVLGTINGRLAYNDEIWSDYQTQVIRGWTPGRGYRRVNNTELSIDPFERKPGYVDRILVMLSQS